MIRNQIRAAMAVALLVAVMLAPVAYGFYLPSPFSMRAYQQDEQVLLWWNKAFSDLTHLPFVYADLPFVCPLDNTASSSSGPTTAALNLGELFRGDRIVLSPVQLHFLKPVTCAALCTRPLDDNAKRIAHSLVSDAYLVEWIVDDLPSGSRYESIGDPIVRYETGFPLGEFNRDNNTAQLYNHFDITIIYEKRNNAFLITAFELQPRMNYVNGACGEHLVAHVEDMTEITYAYSVRWIEDKSLKWETRWERYMASSQENIHWFSIINSIVIVLLLTALVAVILLRALNKDIALYNNDDDLRESQEDLVGWKLVHGDVFRSPKNLTLFSALIGSGYQILSMAIATTFLAAIGFLNPSYRGGLVSYAFFFFAFSGEKLETHRYSGKLDFFYNSYFKTSFVLPGFLFAVVCIMNTISWVSNSSNALPFGTFIALIFIWFGISIPLVFIGSYFGNKKQPIEHPVRTHQIPRQIPDQPWYMKPIWTMLFGGLMPFAVIFLELHSILTSIWQDHYYYMFGFLGLAIFLLILSCIEIAIVIVYFALCGEDYRWHWKAFWSSAGAGIYVFLLSAYYYFDISKHGTGSAGLVYFGYTIIVCAMFMVCTGTIGFVAAYAFLRRIYSVVKID